MPARIQVRRHRRQAPGKYRIRHSHWFDPYPGIAGTEPEKRIFEQLRKLGIYFIFQGQIPEFSLKDFRFRNLAPPVYKPDFVIPEYKVILDPFGPFAHSGIDKAPHDVNKIAVYNIVGYAYYHMWALPNGYFEWSQGTEHVNTDFRHFRRFRTVRSPRSTKVTTLEMLGMIPELHGGPKFPLLDPRDIKAKPYGYRIGEFLGAGANSVAAANHKRKKQKMLTIKGLTRR
jgi:hypothetical protein